MSAFLLFYTYLGYTGLLYVVSRLYARPVKKEDILPNISLVIVAYNEEAVLGRKLENALSLDYPPDLLEVVVISDGSTDGTNELIRGAAEADSRVRAMISPTNQGKDACLAQFVPELTRDLLVFSDANSFYEKDLLRIIARPFADEEIGFVTGTTMYTGADAGRETAGLGLYSRLERMTKHLESHIGSCVGADGAVFAIRSRLFQMTASDVMNDLTLPLAIVQQGYRGILETDAVCYEEETAGMGAAFKRQLRIVNRTIKTLYRFKSLFNLFRFPLFSFQLLSHKGLKLLSPFFILLIFITNIFLLFQSLYYLLPMALQVAIAGLACIGFVSINKFRYNRFINAILTFIMTNSAILIAWITFLQKHDYRKWNTARNKQN